MTPGVSAGADSTAPVAAPPLGLYIHVPFCVSLCPYCDFVVVAGPSTRGKRNRIAAFVAAVLAELRLRADDLDTRWGPRRPALETVYLGGGTPSLLAPAVVGEILGLVRDRFGLAPGAEVTIEANPGRDERGNATAFRMAGINRISYGAQSLDRMELKTLGRRHRVDDVGEAVAEARAGGIGSVNLDLVYDVPGGSLATWIRTLEAAIGWAPDHLSLYALTLDDPDAEGLTGPGGDHLPTTAGARRWRERSLPLQDEDRAAAEYHHAVHRLAEDGWHGYEISNWARPGHEGRHNLGYWERRPYEAVGPGAHAFDGARRRWNAARLDRYIAALSGPTPVLPPGGFEDLDEATADAERVILGLRTDRGIALDEATRPPFADEFGWALAAELVAVTPDDRIVLTTRGRLLSNELFSRLV